jgi:hypothetical protein
MSAYPAPAAQPQVPGQLPSSQAQPAPAYVPPPTTGYGQQAPPLQSKRPKKAVKIVAIVAGILLLSCIGVAVFAALINAGYIPGSITDGDSAKMPYEVTAYGHDYTVSGYVVYDNADGDTTVGLSMEDFQGIPLSGGRLQIPLDCYIIDTEGKEYGYSSLTAGQGLLAFTFDGSIDADKIVLMAADDDSTRAEFPANKES